MGGPKRLACAALTLKLELEPLISGFRGFFQARDALLAESRLPKDCGIGTDAPSCPSIPASSAWRARPVRVDARGNGEVVRGARYNVQVDLCDCCD